LPIRAEHHAVSDPGASLSAQSGRPLKPRSVRAHGGRAEQDDRLRRAALSAGAASALPDFAECPSAIALFHFVQIDDA
jgi:hypothetical protein